MNEHSFIFVANMRIRDENKMQAIREKALEMIVDKGFDGLSMQKLAKLAGVSPATIYIYFKDREDLILQLYVEASRKMTDATLKGFDPSMPFREGLQLQWLNRAKYCLKHSNQIRFMEQLRHSPLQEKAMKLMDPRFKNAMQEFTANAINRKELIKIPVEVYWSIAFAPLYNLVDFHRSGMSVGGRKFVLTEEAMKGTLELVLKALKP